MSVESAISFFLAILVFGITPGPGVFAILARSMIHGSRSCFMLSLGMSVSDIVYLIFACLGLAAVAENWSGLFTAIRFAGAAYLLYLGWTLFTTPIAEQADHNKKQDSHLLNFTQGFLISVSNPKVILFYIAFLPTFMDLGSLSLGGIALASVLTLFALMIGLMGIACTSQWAGKQLRTPSSARRLNQIAGSIMISAGVYHASR